MGGTHLLDRAEMRKMLSEIRSIQYNTIRYITITLYCPVNGKFGEIIAIDGEANVWEKIRKARLRWLGHVERKTDTEVEMRIWL